MPAALLPLARFAAARLASSRPWLIPSDAARAADNCEAAAELLAPAADFALSVAGEWADLAVGEPGPDAKAATGTAAAAAVSTAATATRRYGTGMTRFLSAGSDASQSSAAA
jgi:hypothetical protein